MAPGSIFVVEGKEADIAGECVVMDKGVDIWWGRRGSQARSLRCLRKVREKVMKTEERNRKDRRYKTTKH